MGDTLYRPMKASDDRHPLLFVYVEDVDPPDDIRIRTKTQGAAAILSRWPEHVTFTWVVTLSIISAVLVFFGLVFAMLTATAEETTRPPVHSCQVYEDTVESQYVAELHKLQSLEDGKDRTYFIDVPSAVLISNQTACAVQSYLTKSVCPTYYIQIGERPTNKSTWDEVEKNHKNFEALYLTVHSFFNGTVFQNFTNEDPKVIKFLAKILIAWDFGGLVIDSSWLSVSRYDKNVSGKNVDVLIGASDGDIGLIDSKRWCHTFIFEIIKAVMHRENLAHVSEADIVKSALRKFCKNNINLCKYVKFMSEPMFCSLQSNSSDCVLMNMHTNDPEKLETVLKNMCVENSTTL